MKSLDYFISEPYLMDGVGSSTSGNTLTSSDDQWRFKQNPVDSASADSKPTEGTTDGGSGTPGTDTQVNTEAAKKQFGFSVIPGKDGGVDGYNLTGQDIDGDKTNDTIRIGKDGKIDFGLSKFSDGEKAGILEQAYKNGGIDPTKVGSRGDLKKVEQAWTDTIKQTQEKASTLRSQANAAVTESSDPNVKTESQIREEADHLDALLTKPAGAEAGEAAKTNEAEAQLSPDQEKILADLNNYNEDTFGVNDPTKPALHVDKDGKPGYCTDSTCGKTHEIKDDKGNITGYSFDKIRSKDGVEHTLRDISTADLKAANDRYKSNQAAKLAKPEQSSDTSEVPLPKPKEDVDLARALELKSEDGRATVIRRGDGVEGDPNHDNAEAKSFLLDGQLDSSKNTFATFDINGEKYLGFHSEGFGAGDERSGVVKLSDIDGKNLGADGWKPLSSLGSEAKSIGDSLKSAHAARKAEIAKFGGIEGYNQSEKIRETISRLQNHSTKQSEDGKYSLSGEGATSEQLTKLNDIMGRLNNFGEPLSGIQDDLNTLLSEKSSKENKTLADNVLDQRISELTDKGFSTDEINKLKEGGIDHAELDKAINDKRDKAHALSEADKTKFADTIKDLESRATPKQKAILDKLKGMAGKDGLDKMGKYLQTELKNLAAKVAPKPKPEPEANPKSRGESGVDLGGEGFKALEKSLSPDVMKSVFGDNYKENKDNKALSEAIKDFESIKGDKNAQTEFLNMLQGKFDAKKFEESKNTIDKEIGELKPKVEKLIKEAGDDKEKLEELKKNDDVKKIGQLSQAQLANKKIEELAGKYSQVKVGEADKLGIKNKDGSHLLLDGSGTVDKQGKFQAKPKDEAYDKASLEKAITSSNVDPKKLQEYMKKEGLSFEYHTGADGADGKSWCGPCEGNKGNINRLAELVSGNLKKTPYDSSPGFGVPRLDIIKNGKVISGVSGGQADINGYLGALLKA